MKSFKEYISETHGTHVPVVSLDKNHADLKTAETVREINKNLKLQLNQEFESVETALHKVKKVLSMYAIELPEINLSDDNGTITVPVSQGHVSGEKHSGAVVSPDEAASKTDTNLVIKYSEGDAGYKVSASIN